jgi:hypothetical protein
MSDSTKHKSQPLNFNDLKLETIVIELRYPFTFLLWDVAGELCHELEGKLPGSFVLINASPASVTVSYAARYDINVEQERLALSSSDPNASLTEFLEILQVLFDTVTDKLKIEVFNRIGFRQIFVKEYSSIKKAVAALRSMPSIVIPEKILSDYENDFIAPGLTLRVENETRGALFNIRGGERSFEVAVPNVFRKDAKIQRENLQHFLLSFDVDFYTKVEIPVGQLSIIDWVKQAHETVKRDAAKFF